MDGKNATNLELVFAIVTFGIILLVVGIITFVFVYQRKMQRKKRQIQEMEVDYQKDMVNAVIEAREMEQRRIALELHDDVGSTLTAIKFSVASLPTDLESKESLNANLNSAIQKVRRISNELLPSILEELGLVTAANSLVKQINEQIPTTQFTIQAVQDPAATDQTKDVNLAFYRVLQELLNNIIKYAEATIVTVWLNQNEDGLEMIVTDNGVGFTPEDHKNRERPSLGLKNMESRMQKIGGKMQYSKLDVGTKVSVTWNSQEEK